MVVGHGTVVGGHGVVVGLGVVVGHGVGVMHGVVVSSGLVVGQGVVVGGRQHILLSTELHAAFIAHDVLWELGLGIVPAGHL